MTVSRRRPYHVKQQRDHRTKNRDCSTGLAGVGMAEDSALGIDGGLPEAEPVPARSDGEAELHAHRAVRERGRAGELVVDLLLERDGLA